MNNSRSFFSLFLFLISQIYSHSISVGATNSEIEKILGDLIHLRNFNASETINGILSHNWMENHECLIELNAINKGLENQEIWAIKSELHLIYLLCDLLKLNYYKFFVCLVVDSWAHFPSGVSRGNLHNFGPLPQCCHIERNGEPYKTQYCLGKLKLKRYI